MAEDHGAPVELRVGTRTVQLSSPERVYFPKHGWTKLDVAQYYLAVGDGIVRALRERPCMLHRFPQGVDGQKVHQKRRLPGRPTGSRRSSCSSPGSDARPTNCA